MIEYTQEDIKKLVSSFFNVNEIEISLSKMKFYISDKDFKMKFVEITQELEEKNLFCTLEKKSDNTILIISKVPPAKKKKMVIKNMDTKDSFCCDSMFCSNRWIL